MQGEKKTDSFWKANRAFGFNGLYQIVFQMKTLFYCSDDHHSEVGLTTLQYAPTS